jgi:FkbM family methyltransferase
MTTSNPWIIDIGAFDGQKGKSLANEFGGGFRILYIEPDCEIFKKIETTPQDLALNIAIADHDGEIDFLFYQPGTHSVLKTNPKVIESGYVDGFTGKKAAQGDWSEKKKIRVPCRRLDSLCREYGIDSVRFLKVDTQGFDLEVLKSLGNDIKKVDELVCEVQLDGFQIYEGAAKKQEFIDYLHKKGFLWIRHEFQTFAQEQNLYFKRADLLSGLKTEHLVSIVTPSFNSMPYIEKCIQSVIAQDYPHVEHIIQDAGSTDGTVEVLKHYETHIKWVSEKDGGQSDGLNRALQRATGDVIGVLNADDEFLPHASRWAVENLSKEPDVAVVYGQQYNVDSEGNTLFETEGPTSYDFKRLVCCEDVIPAQAAFIRKTFFEKVGYYADVSRKTCPDYEMWVRIGLKYPIKYVPGVIVKYRMHPGSEGQQDFMIEEMAKSKIEVLKRVCGDNETPLEIRELRRKAHAGIYFWSAVHFMPPLKEKYSFRAIKQIAKSFAIYPSKKTAHSLLVNLINCLFPNTDLTETLRITKSLIREKGRQIDRILFGAFIYKKIYSPLKENKKQKKMRSVGKT